MTSACVSNQIKTFPIKKRINTELFIHGMAGLYLGETQVSNMTIKANLKNGIL